MNNSKLQELYFDYDKEYVDGFIDSTYSSINKEDLNDIDSLEELEEALIELDEIKQEIVESLNGNTVILDCLMNNFHISKYDYDRLWDLSKTISQALIIHSTSPRDVIIEISGNSDLANYVDYREYRDSSDDFVDLLVFDYDDCKALQNNIYVFNNNLL